MGRRRQLEGDLECFTGTDPPKMQEVAGVGQSVPSFPLHDNELQIFLFSLQ